MKAMLNNSLLKSLFCSFLFFTLFAFGQTTYTWDGSTNDWSDASHWSPNGVPGSSDTAIITNGIVTVSDSRTVNNLTLNVGTISGSGTLTVNGTMTWTRGIMMGSGTTIINSSGTLLINNTNDVHLDERTLENNGTITWTGNRDIKLEHEALILNQSGAIFDIQVDGRMDYVFADSGGSFINRGTLTKSAGSDKMEIDPVFWNDGGTINVNSGTLRFERGDTLASSHGDFNTASGAVLEFSERPFFLDNVNFGGSGTIEMIDRATLNVEGSGIYIGASVIFIFDTDHQGSDGFFQGAGPITVDGIFDWKHGKFTDPGTITVNGEMDFDAGGTKELDEKTIINFGNIEIDGSVRVSGNAFIDNRSGGVIDFHHNENFQYYSPNGGTLSNAGTILKSGGIYTSEIQLASTNSGTIDIQSGTIRFTSSLTTTASTVIQGSGALRVSGISFTNNGDLIPGASPGLFSVTGSYTQGGSGEINAEIGGFTPGILYDQIDFSSSLNLAGTLNISLINGFTPIIGQEYEIITCGSRSGIFDAVNFPTLNGNPAFSITYESDRVVLTALEGGDAVTVDAKVWLEGPYTGSNMTTELEDEDIIPVKHPFENAPYNYAGDDSVITIPNNVTDWVLVSLRSAVDSSEVASRAGFLKRDGSITDLDGSSPLYFSESNGNYFIVIEHRNHLGIMSASPQFLNNGSSLYDFTTSQFQAHGTNPMSELTAGVYGMIAGDSDGDGGIDAADKNAAWREQNGTIRSYSKCGDLNLDGGIDARDVNLFWRQNNGLSTQVP